MKKIILSIFLLFPAISFANEDMDFDGECYVQGKDNSERTCKISITRENNLNYELLKLDKTEYVIETSDNCDEDSCKARLGTTMDNLKSAKRLFRDYQSKKVVNEVNDFDWVCTKQTQGALEVCFVIK